MRKKLWIAGALAGLLVVVFLLLRTPDTDPAAMRAKYGGPPSQFVTLANGLTVHVRDEGPRDAPVLMLLHGSNSDLHTWQPWVERLAGDYRIVRFDQRGHGLTGGYEGATFARADFADDVEAVTDALGIDRFVLGGNSMGGAIAMQYAIDHPGRLDGLVLVDAAGAPIENEGSGNIGFTLLRTPGVGRVVSQVMPRAVFDRSLRQSITNQDIVTPQMVDRYYELAHYPGNRDATVARFSQPDRTFTDQAVAGVNVPTLVMWGEADPLIPVAAADWFAQTLPDARRAIYPGIGHLPMEEAADRSAGDVRAFMRGLRIGSQPSQPRQPLIRPLDAGPE